MSERKVSVESIYAGMCWAVGLVGAVANIFTPRDVGTLAAAFLSAAICFTIRSTVERQAAHTAQVFRLGREAERRHPSGPQGV